MAENAEKRPDRILVMDDDDHVRIVLGEILSQIGCEPVLARSGEDAVALFREARDGGEPFAAVIVDLAVRSGMGGLEAAEKLLALDPKAKIIVTSAYITHPAMTQFKQHGFSACMGKPFRIAQLREILRNVLG